MHSKIARPAWKSGRLLLGSVVAFLSVTCGERGPEAVESVSSALTVLPFEAESLARMGGSAYSTGPLGADGGSTTGEGIMMGQKVKVREITTKKSDKEVFHKSEVDSGKGFVVIYEDVCKK